MVDANQPEERWSTGRGRHLVSRHILLSAAPTTRPHVTTEARHGKAWVKNKPDKREVLAEDVKTQIKGLNPMRR